MEELEGYLHQKEEQEKHKCLKELGKDSNYIEHAQRNHDLEVEVSRNTCSVKSSYLPPLPPLPYINIIKYFQPQNK